MLHVWILPVLALTCAALWLVIRLAMHAPLRRCAGEAVFIGYLAVMLYVTFFLPLPARPDDGSLWAAVNVVPARTIVGIYRDYHKLVIWELFGNVAMFVPLGLLLPLLSSRFRRFATTVAVGLSVSVGIELVQLAMLLTVIARRSVDIDDVMLNVLGACLGYLIWRGADTLPRLLARRSGVIEVATSVVPEAPPQ